MPHTPSTVHPSPSLEVHLHCPVQAQQKDDPCRLPQQIPSHKEILPTELHQNIHHINFSIDRLIIIWGVVEQDHIHNTLFQLTLNRWPKCIQQIPQIAWHFCGTRDELSIKDGLLTTGGWVSLPQICTTEPWQIFMTISKALRRCNSSPKKVPTGLE